jgi:hypothetical protein
MSILGRINLAFECEIQRKVKTSNARGFGFGFGFG